MLPRPTQVTNDLLHKRATIATRRTSTGGKVEAYPITCSRHQTRNKICAAETAGFQIDTVGTFHGMTLKSVTEGAAKKASAASAAGAARSAEAGGGGPGPKKRVSRTPIIIIPATNNSLITMYNAKDILQELRFVSTEEKRAAGMQRANEVG